jgi:hypothetical protein
VRSGESAESVAAETGWDLAKVLRYAEPLLDERAFMAQQGSLVEVRRSGGGATLEESCAQQLGAERAASIAWDSFRREDGRWIVTADVPGQGIAAWTYDHHGRNLHPIDDLARALMGVAPAAQHEVTDDDIAAALDLATPVSVVREAPAGRPHLVAVDGGASADDAESDDAESDDAEPDGAEHPGVDVVSAELESDLIGTGVTYEQETITLPREALSGQGAGTGDERPAANRKNRGRKGRTSIPSWDEILFGAGRSED